MMKADLIQADELVLARRAGSARAARVTIRARVAPGVVREIAELLVSELVNNALAHGKGEIRLRVQVDEHVLTVAVTDEGAERPVLASAEQTEAIGRGLRLVDFYAKRWGVTDVQGSGKSVWFELALR